MATKPTRIRKADESPLAKVPATSEMGSTGLKRWGGQVYEEFLSELKGQRANKVYTEMSSNDPIVGAILFVIEKLIRAVEWKVDPYSQDPADQETAKFVESNLDDMDQPWSETIAEILSMLVFGWSFHETVYKYRRGDNEVQDLSSKYSDGRLGWKKIPIRAQETLWQWDFDENGAILGMIQSAPPSFHMVKIPISKGLLFRTTSHKGNPEGKSILRNAYRPWFFKRHIENIEAIGVERDLAGLPIIWVPPNLLDPNASAEDKTVLAEYKKIATNVKRDEQEGIVFPLAFDGDGNKVYDITLLGTGSKRQFDTTAIINRYSQHIAVTVLADFILLGHEKVGSFALSSSKTGIFSTAIGAWLMSIAEVFNRFEVPRLLRLNGMNASRAPKLTHGDIESVDLAELGAYITALAGAGVQLFPDGKLEAYLKRQANLPVEETDDELGTGGAPVIDTSTAPASLQTASSLEGAQIASMVQVVTDVAAGLIPRESGVAILVSAFGLDEAAAEKIMGTAGSTFVPKPAPAAIPPAVG